MPKNSPWRISKETPSRACSSRYSRAAKGRTIRSLSESTRWVGMRKVFFRSSTFDREGRLGARGAARALWSCPPAVDVAASRAGDPAARGPPAFALARRRSSSSVGARAVAGGAPAERRSAAGAAAGPALAQDDDELDPLARGRLDVEGLAEALAAGRGSAAGTRPGSRRACGSSSRPLRARAPSPATHSSEPACSAVPAGDSSSMTSRRHSS